MFVWLNTFQVDQVKAHPPDFQVLFLTHMKNVRQCIDRSVLGWPASRPIVPDDSTPVSQSRHTLRFEPIAYRGIMRRPRADPRPGMVWQAYQPDTAHGELAVFEMAEKKPGKRHCCYGQCRSDERYPDRCEGVTFLPFPKPKTRLEDCKAWIKACGRPHDQLNPSVITKNYYVCSKVRITSSALVHDV